MSISRDVEAEKSHFKIHGWARIESVFRKEEMDELRALIWRAYRYHNADLMQFRNDIYPALMFGGYGFDKFKKSKRLAHIVRGFLGDDIDQLNDQTYFRLPGDGDSFNWHRDIMFRTPASDFRDIENGYLQTAIIVDDFTLETSPIEFLVDSHKVDRDDLLPRDNSEKGLRDFPEQKEGQAVRVPLPRSGDVLVWSVMIAHGSKPNTGRRSRVYHMQGFAKTSAVRPDKFPAYMRNGELV